MRVGFVGLFCFSFICLFGQSYFYNTQQFGLKSTLLGGAVTAGSSDLSMIYYNPAALKYARNKGFDFALFMPSYTFTSFGDKLGSGREFTDRRIALIPSLLTYKTSIGDNINIVFSFLQKDQWDNDYRHVFTDQSNARVLKNAFSYDHQGDEKWFGVGSSIDLSENVSFGISQFWSILSSSYEYGLSSEIQDLNNNELDRFYSDQFDLTMSSTLSMVTKLGFSYDGGENKFGVVLTTPNYLPIHKGGDLEKATSIRDLGRRVTTNVIDFDIDPQFKNPWQVEIGYSRILPDKSTIWVKGSYHTQIQSYEVFSVDRTNLDGLIFSNGFNEVTNFAVGYAKDVSEKFQVLASARTNFSAAYDEANSQRNQNTIVLEQDRFHLALGAKIAHRSSSFVVGLDYGFSHGNGNPPFQNFPNIELLNLQDTNHRQRVITVILTYQFFLDTMGRNISRILDRS